MAFKVNRISIRENEKSALRSQRTLELKAEGLPDTILYSEESVVVNVQIFNVSMTIRRAGETLR